MRTHLIAAREAKGLSQEQLGTCIERTRSAVAKYETGLCDIPGGILHKLSQVLGIAMEELLWEERPTAPRAEASAR